MRISQRVFAIPLVLLLLPAGCSSPDQTTQNAEVQRRAVPSIHMPWRESGLTERQAAAHLLGRFTFGARPGDVDRVVTMGLNAWMEEQLRGLPENPLLMHLLDSLPSVSLSNAEIAARYPTRAFIKKEMRADPRYASEVAYADSTGGEKREFRSLIRQYMEEHAYRPESELVEDLRAQKLFRAVLSTNQLQEVLTDFWTNHFNVSVTNARARPFVQTFERDAIRPNVFGKFRTMLEATARHPAMLYYLNNAESVAEEGTVTTVSYHRGFVPRYPARANSERKGKTGLNENYARELMELHTLGVDGGYTQTDVTEVARAFTGWTVYPLGPSDKQREQIDRILSDPRRHPGFVRQGDFLFRAGQHDARPKQILGESFPPGGGIEEGERVLDMLANYPSTATFISRELAARFVADTPSVNLVNHLSAVFMRTGGDLQAIIIAMVESPEFWSNAALREKIKSPFELVVSSLRALNATIANPRGMINWVGRMGEPLYACVPPTGYPDRGSAWINTGSILNRMNFGLRLAIGEIPGVQYDPVSLNGGYEPESTEAALRIYADLLLPGRDVTETIRLLTPAVHDPKYAARIQEAANAQEAGDEPVPHGGRWSRRAEPSVSLRSIIGLLLGSPEFQRR